MTLMKKPLLLFQNSYMNTSARISRPPLNTYIGLENQSVLEWESEKDGADKLKQIPYGKFNRTRGLDNTSITFFNNLTQRKTLAFVSWLKEKK